MGDTNLNIADLLLDVDNPRLSGVKSQRDALQKILEDQEEKLVVLATSIVEEGMNPMDRLLVLQEEQGDGGSVVLEGNRRLAALKVLANSSIMSDLDVKPSIRKELERLAKQFDRKQVEPLSCFKVSSREEGNSWILLRHTGENGGKGVVGWSGVAASRFRGQDPALQALDFVRSFGGLTDAQKDQLEAWFPITTLDRLLSSRDVRKRLGFDVKAGKLVSGLPPEELLKALRRIVLDLGEKKINVSALKNKAQQIAYVEKFDKDSKPDQAKMGPVRPVDGIGVGDFRSKSPPKRTGTRRPPDPAARRTLIPKQHGLTVSDNRVAGIVRELGQLKVDDAPNAIAVLFRVFLELSVDFYMDKHKLPTTINANGHDVDKKLKAKVREVVASLVAAGEGVKKDFASLDRGLDDPRSPLSMDLLHAYVHNRFTTPKDRELLGAWDDARRFFQGIWK